MLHRDPDPAEVSSSPLPTLSKSATPSSSSRAATCRPMVGCAVPSARPAAENEPFFGRRRGTRARGSSRNVSSASPCRTHSSDAKPGLSIRLCRRRDALAAGRRSRPRTKAAEEIPMTKSLHRRGVREARAVHGPARARPRLRGRRRVPREERGEARTLQGAHHRDGGGDERPRGHPARRLRMRRRAHRARPLGVQQYASGTAQAVLDHAPAARAWCSRAGGTSRATVRTATRGSSGRS